MTAILTQLAEETIVELVDFQLTHEIPNPVELEFLHATLLWCKETLPDVILNDVFYLGRPTGFEIFKMQPENGGTNCLVLRFTSPGFERRHKALCEKHNINHLGQFAPHITLSYDVGNLDPSTLPKFKFPIHIIREYEGDQK